MLNSRDLEFSWYFSGRLSESGWANLDARLGARHAVTSEVFKIGNAFITRRRLKKSLFWSAVTRNFPLKEDYIHLHT